MIGRRLAHYEVTSQLGKGGMGEVYLARDTTLKREVALKLLPDAIAHDKTIHARFEREAQLLASLNHPGIATVHGFHEESGTAFLAMEYVTGGTLRELMSRESIPLKRALSIALQIASALEAAHARGILHRDVKPSNVAFDDDGRVKVLDFGLACSLDDVAVSSDPEKTAAILENLTQTGAIIGTPGFMSPEQAKGEKVDARADIWSFGALFYELLCGEPAFPGKTIAETLVQVLSADPDLEKIPASAPTEIHRLIRRCLTRERESRLQSIGDARLVLEEVLAGTEDTTPNAERKSPRRWAAIAWLLIPVAAICGWFVRTPEPSTPVGMQRFHVVPPDGLRLVTRYQRGVAFSRDGQTLVYVAGTSDDPLDPHAGASALYVRRLGEWESWQIPGSDGASMPFFSPDDEWIGFDQDRQLKKVRLSGGDPQTISERHAHHGADWSDDGRIAFAPYGRGGIGIVPAAGGSPDTLIVADASAGEYVLRLPHWLPGSKALLFTSLDAGTLMNYEEDVRIRAYSLETGEVHTVVEYASDARYTGDGHLLFAREGDIYSVPFDPVTLRTSGEPRLVLEGVNHAIHAASGTRETAAAQFTLAGNGNLAYLAGSVFPERLREIVWIDRDGNQEPLGIEPRQFSSARLSADGSQALLSTHRPPYDVWTLDLRRDAMRRQTFEGTNYSAIWGPGRDHITINSMRGGKYSVLLKKLDSGPGEVETLDLPMRTWASDWGPRGDTFIGNPWGTGLVTATPDGRPGELNDTGSTIDAPLISPDGNWLVYASAESGDSEVYVRAFPDLGVTAQVSVHGGVAPSWAPDGSEVLYWGTHGDRYAMMAVSFRTVDGRVELGIPEELFASDPLIVQSQSNYDVAADGRFLVIKSSSDSLMSALGDQVYPASIRVVTSWWDDARNR